MPDATSRPLGGSYWHFLQTREEYAKQRMPAVAAWMAYGDDPLTPTEQLIFDHVRGASRLLDIGAGDMRVRDRMVGAGFAGEYQTADLSSEFEPTYRSIEEAPAATFDAVVMLEVIEHVAFDDFDSFIDDVLRVMAPGGRIAVSTPNAECIRSVWASDMTHRHPYRAVDLAAYLDIRGIRSMIYRVDLTLPRVSPRERLRRLAAKVITRGILQVDYAAGVLLLGQRDA